MNRKRVGLLILWVIAGGLMIRFALFVTDEMFNQASDLPGYYAPANMLLAGEPALSFYDDARYNMYVSRVEPGVRQTFSVNPPTTALLFLPLALLPYASAKVLWALLNGAIFVVMLWWLARQLRFTGVWLPVFIIAGLLYHPIYVSIEIGQIYILLLAWELLVWHGYRQGRERLAGIALGLMLIFKLAGLLLWPLLLIQKRWRIMVWGGGTAVLIALLSLPWLGTAAWQQQVSLFFQSPGQPSLLATAYQTWYSLSGRLFTPDTQWNPAPLFTFPAGGTWLRSLGLCILLAVTLFVAYRAGRWPFSADEKRRVNDLLFALFVISGMIINPATLDYHYPLLVLPLAIVAAYAREKGNGLIWLTLLTAFVLVSTDLPYRSPRLYDGLWVVLAYPKLYGCLLLWGLICWGLYRPYKGQVRSPFENRTRLTQI